MTNDENQIPSPFYGEGIPKGSIPSNPFGVRTVVFTETEPGSGMFEQIVYNQEAMVRILNAIEKEMPRCMNHDDLSHFVVMCNDKYKYFSLDIPDSYTNEEIKKMNEESDKEDHELV